MQTENIHNDLESVLNFSDPTESKEYATKISQLIHKYRNVTRLEDSVSDDEIQTKSILIRAIESQKLIDSNSKVVIWGSSYGSILIPYFSKRVAKVYAIDKDDDVVRFAKNKMFSDLSNVELITDDIFATHRDFYLDTDLIVNTACEFMQPMKDWQWFKHGALASDPDFPKGAGDRDPNKKKVFNSPKLSSHCHFAFQSSDMVGIAGRTNSVKDLDDFKNQLPARAEISYEEETPVSGGKIFTLLGKFK